MIGKFHSIITEHIEQEMPLNKVKKISKNSSCISLAMCNKFSINYNMFA